ncbi:MAG: hypothetical protein JRI95_17070 [Deltaproteobacteria bacterium]|nr:hypothetical protein [Deltaproteobacteria bacterium]
MKTGPKVPWEGRGVVLSASVSPQVAAFLRGMAEDRRLKPSDLIREAIEDFVLRNMELGSREAKGER